MDINSAMSTAVNGIRSGMSELDRNTAEVARASKGEGGDIATPLVESKLSQLQVEANVNMVKTLDETLGSLLDVKA